MKQLLISLGLALIAFIWTYATSYSALLKNQPGNAEGLATSFPPSAAIIPATYYASITFVTVLVLISVVRYVKKKRK